MSGNLLKPKIMLETDIKKLEGNQAKIKNHHDKRAKDMKPLHEGDAVVMKPMVMWKKRVQEEQSLRVMGGHTISKHRMEVSSESKETGST